jgi:N-acetylneuraminic acid mutarotase
MEPAAAPENDDFDDAIAIEMPFVSQIDTSEATVAGDDPDMPCYDSSAPHTNSNTVWYTFRASSSGWLRIDAGGSDYDTVVALWTGSRGSLSAAGCNDDYYLDATSRLDVWISRGQTYHIEVADYGSPGGGNLHLAVRMQNPVGWAEMSDLPTPRDRLAVVSDGTYVYAIGGEEYSGGFQPSDALQRYDPASDTWTNRASMPVPYSNIDAANLGDEIYVPAGYDGSQITGTHYVYDIGTNSWSTATPAPWSTTAGAPVLWYALAEDTVNDVYYLTGGWNGSALVDTVLRYDAGSDSWTELAPMQTARAGHEAAFMHGKLYVAGGETETVEAYDPNTDSWSYVSDMSSSRLYGASGSGSFCSEVYGDWDNFYMGGNRDRGNIYYASYSTVLEQIRFGVLIASSTSAYFFVYESSSYEGTYTRIYQEYLSSTGTGVGWLVSSEMSVPLVAGRYYYIGASWSGEVGYGNSDEAVPLSLACLGTLPNGNGDGSAGVDPTDSFVYSQIYTYSPYLMQLDLRGSYGPWYVAGGGFSDQAYFLDSTEVYEPLEDRWTVLRETAYNLHEPRRRNGGAVTDAGDFYVVAGQNDDICAGNNCVGDNCLSATVERLGAIWLSFVPAISRSYCSEGDAYEPNDGFSDAYVIASGDTYAGNFACEGDTDDVFRLEMGASRTIEAWLTDIPSGSNFSLCIYDGNQTQLQCSTNAGNADEHLLTGTQSPGTYYIQVYNQGETHVGGTTYQLRTVFQ